LAATRYVAQLRSTDPERLGRVLGVLRLAAVLSSILVGLTMAAASAVIAGSALGDAAVQPLLVLGAIAVVFGGVDGYQTGALVGLEAMRSSALAMLFAVALGAPLTLLLANTHGDAGAVAGLVATYVLQCCGSWWLLRRECQQRGLHVSLRGGGMELRELVGFTAPSMLSGLMVAPTHWFVQAGLMRSATDGVQLALFAVAMQWFYSICFVPQFAGRIILPVLTDARARGQLTRSATILKSTVLAYGVTVVPVALAVALASAVIMGLYGAGLSGGGRALGVVALAAAVASICMPIGQAIAAEGRMWLGFAANLLWALVFAAGATLLAHAGAVGAGLALLIAYVVLLLAMTGILRAAFRSAGTLQLRE
jgi:O-antigen/teichoic acid export membrane protein